MNKLILLLLLHNTYSKQCCHFGDNLYNYTRNHSKGLPVMHSLPLSLSLSLCLSLSLYLSVSLSLCLSVFLSFSLPLSLSLSLLPVHSQALIIILRKGKDQSRAPSSWLQIPPGRSSTNGARAYFIFHTVSPLTWLALYG